MSIDAGRTLVARVSRRSWRAHIFAMALIAFALIGGGLRFIPTSAAAPAGSNAAGGAASTACNAS